MLKQSICLIITGILVAGLPLSANAGDQAEELPEEKVFRLSGVFMDGVRIVEVRAYKYGFEPDPIVVKLGEDVSLRATSSDIKHGLAIRRFKVNMLTPVGEVNTAEFLADKAGDFSVRCSVYCGRGHSRMRGVLKIIK